MTMSRTPSAWTPERVRVVALTLLLSLDALFIGLHLLRAVLNDTSYGGFLLDRRWSLELDRTYPEQFQYLLAGLTAVALLALYILHRALTYLGWMLTFLFVLIDDSFSLHERFTEIFVATTGSTPVLGIEARIYAASILWGAVGLGLLVLLGLGYRRDTASRAFSRHLGYLLIALFICGGVLDALHLLADQADFGRAISFLLGTLEDWGRTSSNELSLSAFPRAFCEVASADIIRSEYSAGLTTAT